MPAIKKSFVMTSAVKQVKKADKVISKALESEPLLSTAAIAPAPEKVKKPRKPLSDEQKAVRVTNLTKAREAKALKKAEKKE